MTTRCVLVSGGGVRACVAALVLAKRGVDVAVIEPEASWPAALEGVMLDAAAIGALRQAGVASAVTQNVDGAALPLRIPAESLYRDLQEQLRRHGVEVRMATELLGFLDLGTHVEAELSNGRVENYDAILELNRPDLGLDQAVRWAERVAGG